MASQFQPGSLAPPSIGRSTTASASHRRYHTVPNTTLKDALTTASVFYCHVCSWRHIFDWLALTKVWNAHWKAEETVDLQPSQISPC
eukprot:4640116-Amphidinium_carterae.1